MATIEKNIYNLLLMKFIFMEDISEFKSESDLHKTMEL